MCWCVGKVGCRELRVRWLILAPRYPFRTYVERVTSKAPTLDRAEPTRPHWGKFMAQYDQVGTGSYLSDRRARNSLVYPRDCGRSKGKHRRACEVRDMVKHSCLRGRGERSWEVRPPWPAEEKRRASFRSGPVWRRTWERLSSWCVRQRRVLRDQPLWETFPLGEYVSCCIVNPVWGLVREKRVGVVEVLTRGFEGMTCYIFVTSASKQMRERFTCTVSLKWERNNNWDFDFFIMY